MTPTEETEPRSAVTPIELFCAAAMAMLVATLGYSAVRTYHARAQVQAGIAAAEGIAPYVARAFTRTGEVPSSDELAAAGELAVRATPFIDSISVTHGRIDVTFSSAAHAAIAGERISLTPYETASLEVVWICGNEPPGPGLRPLGFASGGAQAAGLPATVDSRYLPAHCR